MTAPVDCPKRPEAFWDMGPRACGCETPRGIRAPVGGCVTRTGRAYLCSLTYSSTRLWMLAMTVSRGKSPAKYPPAASAMMS